MATPMKAHIIITVFYYFTQET